MFVIFCNKEDMEAAWLYEQLTTDPKADIEILFIEDLYYCKDWKLKINDQLSFAQVTLANGRIISTKNVTLFLNRVNIISHPFWKMKDLADQLYFEQEWNAFLLGWLKAFEAVLINPVNPYCLSGYSGNSIATSLLAYKAGFKIKEQEYSLNDENIDHLYFQNIDAGTASILVYNKKSYCSISLSSLAEQCLNLASLCHCNLMEIFIEKERNGEFIFLTANSLPAFSKYAHSFVNALRCAIIHSAKKTEKLNLQNKMAV